MPPLVDAAWLSQHPSAVLADVRWYPDGRSPRRAYDAGHLLGAVFVDLDRALAGEPGDASGRHPLPDPADFAAAMAALGIGDDDVVVAYDDAGGVTAARLVWMLRATGSDAALLDARPADRYRGGPDALDPRAGHIPGAVSVPCRENLDAAGRLLPVARLRERFAAAGVRAGTDVISSCGSGVTACHTLLVLEHAGLGAGRLFPGSWSQWSRDPARPAATGSSPHSPDEHPPEPEEPR